MSIGKRQAVVFQKVCYDDVRHCGLDPQSLATRDCGIRRNDAVKLARDAHH
jgi:hypothetical protein